MRKTYALLIGLALCLFLAGNTHAITVGKQVPAFEVTTLNGQRVALQSYTDQGPLLLFFWTTWCHYCKGEMHAIQDLQDKYSSKGLQVLGINPGWRDNERRARSFRRRQGLDLTLAFDQSMRLGNRFMLQGVPTLFLVDNQGKIIYRGHGITLDLRSTLDRLLAQS